MYCPSDNDDERTNMKAYFQVNASKLRYMYEYINKHSLRRPLEDSRTRVKYAFLFFRNNNHYNLFYKSEINEDGETRYKFLFNDNELTDMFVQDIKVIANRSSPSVMIDNKLILESQEFTKLAKNIDSNRFYTPKRNDKYKTNRSKRRRNR